MQRGMFLCELLKTKPEMISRNVNQAFGSQNLISEK